MSRIVTTQFIKIKKQRSTKITQWNELDSNYTGYQTQQLT